jgi:hypothetical protein
MPNWSTEIFTIKKNPINKSKHISITRLSKTGYQRFSKIIILKNLNSNTDIRNDDHQQWYKEEIIQSVYEKMQELEMPTNILLHIDNIKGFL